MTTDDLYGISAATLDDARALVEQRLGIALAPRESSYLGGPYFRFGDRAGEHFVLQSNYDSVEDEWSEPGHRGSPFLLYVHRTERSEEIEARLGPHIPLLERKTA
jgi:hypothetical protein